MGLSHFKQTCRIEPVHGKTNLYSLQITNRDETNPELQKIKGRFEYVADGHLNYWQGTESTRPTKHDLVKLVQDPSQVNMCEIYNGGNATANNLRAKLQAIEGPGDPSLTLFHLTEQIAPEKRANHPPLQWSALPATSKARGVVFELRKQYGGGPHAEWRPTSTGIEVNFWEPHTLEATVLVVLTFFAFLDRRLPKPQPSAPYAPGPMLPHFSPGEMAARRAARGGWPPILEAVSTRTTGQGFESSTGPQRTRPRLHRHRHYTPDI